jgi:hypothetical protein
MTKVPVFQQKKQDNSREKYRTRDALLNYPSFVIICCT